MATRTVQHKEVRESRVQAQAVAELRRENRVLRRQVTRLQKENDRLLALNTGANVPEQSPEPAEEKDVVDDKSDGGCRRCGAEVKDILLPTGTTLRVCTGCRFRERI